jgi:hypothetical protein
MNATFSNPAHPHYLKVRRFGVSPEIRDLWDAKTLVLGGPDVLPDLAALYQPSRSFSKPNPLFDNKLKNPNANH